MKPLTMAAVIVGSLVLGAALQALADAARADTAEARLAKVEERIERDTPRSAAARAEIAAAFARIAALDSQVAALKRDALRQGAAAADVTGAQASSRVAANTDAAGSRPARPVAAATVTAQTLVTPNVDAHIANTQPDERLALSLHGTAWQLKRDLSFDEMRRYEDATRRRDDRVKDIDQRAGLAGDDPAATEKIQLARATAMWEYVRELRGVFGPEADRLFGLGR